MLIKYSVIMNFVFQKKKYLFLQAQNSILVFASVIKDYIILHVFIGFYITAH